MEKIEVGAPGARIKFQDWISNRGGVRVWKNVSLPNTGGGEMFTPADDPDGGRYPKPNWSVDCGETVITDINAFRFVKSWQERKRFHVAIRRGTWGLSFKCTDASSRKIWAKCEKFPGSSYRFDYATQEAVIEVPEWESDEQTAVPAPGQKGIK
ncbi:MAG: hypothetical protein ABIJ57_04145 [Pseudomonadota bacterium]